MKTTVCSTSTVLEDTMSLAAVDSTTIVVGNVVSEAAFSEGDDASNSGEEVEQQDENEEAMGSVQDIPSFKRPFQDSQTEPDLLQAKKRRKQSKPVRLFSLTDPSEKDSDEDQEATTEGKTHSDLSTSSHEHQIPKESVGSNAEPDIDPDPVSESITVMEQAPEQEPLPHCPYCPTTLDPKDRLKHHIENGHVQKLFQSQLQHLTAGKSEIPLNLSSLSAADSTSPIDFVVGHLMTEIKHQNDDSSQGTKLPLILPQVNDPSNSGSFAEGKMSLPGYVPLAPHFLLPLMSQGSTPNQPPSVTQSQNQGPGTTPIRIFNPDAYCELCNKEFCNKYFLKTHKANKHGIYVDSPGNNVPGSPYPFVQANLNLSYIPTPTTALPTSKTMPVVPKLPETVISNKMSTNGQMKAFCDICQKRFCNKYFVRRHKAKIHGINDESFPSSGNGTLLNLSDCIRKDFDEPGSLSAGSDTGSNVVETGSGDIPTNVSEAGELRISLHEKQNNSSTMKLSPTNSAVDEITESSNVKEEPDQELEEGRSPGEYVESSSLASMKSSPTPLQHTFKEGVSLDTDRLRRLGVINADAFCEICCKEYCNKYFLRTHKMKRHGIYISDGDGREVKPGGSNNMPWNYIQTSPLNLIVGEQGTNSSDSGEKNRNDLSDSDDPECDLCGRRFQSFYLMQMHRVYLHMTGGEKKETGQSELNESNVKRNENINTEGSEGSLSKTRDANTPEVRTFNNNNSNGGKDVVGDDLQKLQTMILQLNNLNVSKARVCTICNKETENHYCLRAHMMTDHGILVEDQNGVEGDKIPDLELSPVPPLIDSQTYCFTCKKDFYTQFQLKQHVDEFHSYPTPSATSTPLAGNTIKEEFDAKSPPEKPHNQNMPHVTPEKRISLTPTSSYCEICNKELCNKYFMKTHMQRMHGIEIENGAQIGGVICDICNKELCSKYFLRVHKQNTHGIVEDGSTSHTTRDNGNGPNIQNTLEADHALKPAELSDLSHRYFSHFTEVCSICNRRFRSTKWLKAHLLNDHGENGIDKLKELENQYHALSQGKHQLPNLRGAVVNSTTDPGSNYSPTLKIPNNWKSQDQDNGCSRPPSIIPGDRSNEMGSHQVFTNFFGAGDPNMKTYHCSYCPFTTPVLALLFVHERSHGAVSQQQLPDPSKPFQCPVCLQSFLQAEVFQHHILTHQLSGIFNPFFGPSSSSQYSPHITNTQEHRNLPEHSPNCGEGRELGRNESKPECEVIEDEAIHTPEGKYKFRCSKCFQRFRSKELCMAHIQSKHNNTSETTSVPAEIISIKVTNNGLYKCTRCGFSSAHMVIVKKHIRKEHKSESSQTEKRQEPPAAETLIELKEAVTDEVKKKLQEAARKSQVPASYAVPQNQAPCLDRFVMQPFLLQEPDGTPTSEQLQLDRKFVPSLVFLPVKEKLSEPLTVSFTLTPA